LATATQTKPGIGKARTVGNDGMPGVHLDRATCDGQPIQAPVDVETAAADAYVRALMSESASPCELAQLVVAVRGRPETRCPNCNTRIAPLDYAGFVESDRELVAHLRECDQRVREVQARREEAAAALAVVEKQIDEAVVKGHPTGVLELRQRQAMTALNCASDAVTGAGYRSLPGGHGYKMQQAFRRVAAAAQ